MNIQKIYLHGSEWKEGYPDLTEEQLCNLENAAYEVGIEIDVDTGDIISVDGKKVEQ